MNYLPTYFLFSYLSVLISGCFLSTKNSMKKLLISKKMTNLFLLIKRCYNCLHNGTPSSKLTVNKSLLILKLTFLFHSRLLLINKDDHSKSHIINADMVLSKTILDSDISYESVTKAYLTKLYDRPNQIDALVRRTMMNNSKCTKIIDLLRKNNQNVINENGVLKISDHLIILPPYGSEQCISNDKYLLETVKNIIKSNS